MVFLFILSKQAYAQNFPYSFAGMKWSQDLGKATNGCAKLDKNGSPQLNSEGFPIQDNSMCATLPAGNSFEVKPEFSEAALKCRQIGGHLPTVPEYQKLIRSLKMDKEYYESTNYGPLLKISGLKKLAKAFHIPSLHNKVFWSSTVMYSDSRVGCRLFGDTDQSADPGIARPIGGLSCDLHFGFRGATSGYLSDNEVLCVEDVMPF